MKRTYMAAVVMSGAIAGMQRPLPLLQQLTRACTQLAVDYSVIFVSPDGQRYSWRKMPNVPEQLYTVVESIVKTLAQGFVVEQFSITAGCMTYVPPAVVLQILDSNFYALSPAQQWQYQAVYAAKRNYLLQGVAADAPGCFVMADIGVANLDM